MKRYLLRSRRRSSWSESLYPASILPHPFPILFDALQYRLSVCAGREPICAPCNDDAGGKPLDIPLPGTWKRLIKVIHIENLIPFRCSVDAKVTEMSITTDLHLQTCNRSRGEILGHNHRRPTQKAKGRGGHATVADRQQLCLPEKILLLEQADRVWSIR